MLTRPEREALAAKKSDISETTIDNRTTYPQVAYLARLITGKHAARLRHRPTFQNIEKHS
jgi:hypothetical protein